MLWSKWQLSNQIQPFAKLTYQDNELQVPASFVYPAGITNPNYYGGKKIKASLGADLHISATKKLVLGFNIPVYHYLNRIQPKGELSTNIYWNVQF